MLSSVRSACSRYLNRARRRIQRGCDDESVPSGEPNYRGPFSAVVPARLARASIRDLPPAVSDQAHVAVRDQAMSWQQIAG